jgi:hypothetical protein
MTVCGLLSCNGRGLQVLMVADVRGPGLFGWSAAMQDATRHLAGSWRRICGKIVWRSTLAQVKGMSADICKTVGLAYVGSNPTPATTCGNSPWPASMQAGADRVLGWACAAVCSPKPPNAGGRAQYVPKFGGVGSREIYCFPEAGWRPPSPVRSPCLQHSAPWPPPRGCAAASSPQPGQPTARGKASTAGAQAGQSGMVGNDCYGV